MGGHFNKSRTGHGGNARAFCERMALVKSDELLETPSGQSAAKSQIHLRKVQRLPEGYSSLNNRNKRPTPEMVMI
jgi:hypothetical protein